MSEFTSETSQAAQEEVEQIGATPEQSDPLVKDPSEWVSGDDPITDSQKSYLDNLATQAGETLPAEMTKAEASQHIDRLRGQLKIDSEQQPSDRVSIRFKDLCLDVADTPRMARFWSAVLGLETEFRGDDARLGDGVDEHTVWLNRVPEPRTVKHRVHLDVHAAAVDDLVACGATVLHTAPAWTVLTDPEGGEFCAFVRDDPPSYRLYGISVDTADETSLARWWADRFEAELQAPAAEDHCWVPATAGLPCDLVFAAVPEPKRSKNRWHLDVWGDVDELVAAGATLLRRRDQEIAWNVLADPEGNEFCVFFPPA